MSWIPRIFPRSRAVAALAAVTILAASCGSESSTEAGAPSPDAAPAEWAHTFTGDTYAGGTFDAGDYEGQDLVLWFWAPW